MSNNESGRYTRNSNMSLSHADDRDFMKMTNTHNNITNNIDMSSKQSREYSIRRKTDTYSPYSTRTFPSLRQNSNLSNSTSSASTIRTKKSYKSLLEQSSQFSVNSSSWRNDNSDSFTKTSVYLEQFKRPENSSRNKSKMEISKSMLSGHYHPLFHGSTVIRLSGV